MNLLTMDPPPKPKDEGPAMMNLAEAAKYLGISKPTLRRWCRKGEIPHIKIPHGPERSSWRFSKAALDERLRAAGEVLGR